MGRMLLWWKTSFPQSLRFGFWIVLLKRHWLGHIKPDYSPTLALATLRKESESTSKTIMAASPNRKLWWGILGFSGSRLDEWSSWNCRHAVNGLLITWSIWYCQYRANFTRSKLDSFLLIFMAEFRALCSECATFCKRKAAGFCSSWARAALKTANISAICGAHRLNMETLVTILLILGWVRPCSESWVFLAKRKTRSLDFPCVVLEFTRQWHSGWSTCLQLENLWCWAQRMKFLVGNLKPRGFFGDPNY